MIDSNIKFIAIVGPTASGKTALALALAKAFNGEIVCADSRTIYRGMDIGTAKPTKAEQAMVRHHLLDVVDPHEVLSAAAFKILAESAIQDVASRGRVPFLVGGSGLYIDAVMFDYEFPSEADPQRRAYLEGLSDETLLELLAAEDAAAYEKVDLANRRRVIRAIETAGQAVSRTQVVRPGVLVLGTLMNKEVIQKRIEQRVEKMLSKGLIDEVKNIGEQWGWETEAMSGIGYRAFRDVVLGTKTIEEAKSDFVRGDMRLVKKQLTWFKRNPNIRWLDDPAKAEGLVREFLQSDRPA